MPNSSYSRLHSPLKIQSTLNGSASKLVCLRNILDSEDYDLQIIRLAKLKIHVVSTVRTAPSPKSLLQKDHSCRIALPSIAKPHTAD